MKVQTVNHHYDYAHESFMETLNNLLAAKPKPKQRPNLVVVKNDMQDGKTDEEIIFGAMIY